MKDFSSFKWLYVCSAKGIQNYIFKVSKLKQIIGASELIEGLRNDLEQTLKELRISDYNVIQLAGGNARLLFSSEADALSFAELWPLKVRYSAPGLQVVQAVVNIERHGGFMGALNQSETVLRANRNIHHPDLPPVEPVVERNRRTGLPAVQNSAEQGIDEPFMDRETRQKLRKECEVRTTGIHSEHFLDRIGLTGRWPGKKWIREFEHIAPGRGQYMAVIHSDADALGQKLIKMGKQLQGRPDSESIEAYRLFSQAVEESVRKALLDALSGVVDSVGDDAEVPVRVIICAGDDLTLVMPGEYAFDFTQVYLRSFEDHYRELQSKNLGIFDIDFNLTASAGIAYVKSNFPFAQACSLAESLCKYTKKKLNRQVSGLAFHRITTSGIAEFKDILDSELTIRKQESGYEELTVLSMVPYAVRKKTDGCMAVENIKSLVTALKKMPRGSIRQLVSAMYLSREEADRAYDRITQVAAERDKLKQAMQNLESVLESFKTNRNDLNPLWAGKETINEFGKTRMKFCTPLMDALELIAVGPAFKEDAR